MPNSSEPTYVRALPDFEDLDSEHDGSRFATKIQELFSEKQIDRLTIDLSGAYTDYYGCCPISDACISILLRGKSGQTRQLNVITSFRNDLSAQYAMLFFYKSRLHQLPLNPEDYEAISKAARDVCKTHNLEFNVYVVSPTFEYDSLDALGVPDFVLSSK
ncbi:MAG: hypothetical protein WAW73_03295 [Rhodoferax sp.]